MPKVLLRSGFHLHYLRTGQGPDMVLLHGITGNLAIWHLKMVPLLRNNFHVLTYDFRGHGHSDAPPTGYSVGDFAQDLEELLDALGIDTAYLVGHSYGADVALYFALLHPERVKHVVAIESGLPALINVRQREDWEGWASWRKALESCGIEVPPDKRCDVDYLIRATLDYPKIYGPASGRPRKKGPLLRLLDETSLKEDYEKVGALTLESVSRIHTPVHLIVDERSPYQGTYQYLLEHLPNVTGSILRQPPHDETAGREDAAGGHFAPLEQPREVIEQVLGAFARTASLPVSPATSE